jgi:exodeoxyribonuclease V alpha subunit
MTVHKAQGREHDEIMLVLPSRPSALLTREVLYTAITRARKSVAVVGREAFLEAALRQTGTRDTRLARKLG